MAHGGRARGREQCGSNKNALLFFKNLTTGLIWLGGMGGGVGRWPMEGGQGGRWGGAPESSVGAIKVAPFQLPLTTGLIWLVTRGRRGGMGGGVGRWPMEGGQGGRWGATKGALIPAPLETYNWSDLAGDEGGGMGGRRGEVAHGGRGRGRWGEKCGSNKRWLVLSSLQNPTTGLIWLVEGAGMGALKTYQLV